MNMNVKENQLFTLTKVVLRNRCPERMAILHKESYVMVITIGMQRGRVNAIGAIVGMMFVTLSLFKSSINSDVFYAWLTQDLLPKVDEGAVIVMDNATFHKRKDMLEAIEKAGCIPEFLPTYSPDLNPIEKKWAQAKAIRRKLRCTIDELFTEHLDYRNLI